MKQFFSGLGIAAGFVLVGIGFVWTGLVVAIVCCLVFAFLAKPPVNEAGQQPFYFPKTESVPPPEVMTNRWVPQGSWFITYTTYQTNWVDREEYSPVKGLRDLKQCKEVWPEVKRYVTRGPEKIAFAHAHGPDGECIEIDRGTLYH